MAIDGLPRVHFTTDRVAPSERFDQWREFARKVKIIDPIGGAAGDVRASVKLSRVGALTAAEFSHTAARHTDVVPDRDRFYLGVVSHGETQLTFRDDVRLARPGQLRLSSLNVTEVSHGDYGGRSLVIPYDAIGSDPNALDRTRLSPAAETLLRATLASFFASLDVATTDDTPALEAALTGVVRGLVSPATATQPDRDAIAAQRVRMILRYMTDRCADPALDAAHLCRRFNVSRATLYRVLQPFGGVETVLREERLRHALTLLSRGHRARGEIARIAERLNFADPASFSRAFRRMYGFTASQALAAGDRALGETATITSEYAEKARSVFTPELAETQA